MASDDTKIILEHFDDKFAQMMESIDARIEATVRPIVQDELAEMKDDIKTIKSAVKATNQDVLDHERRITKLEAA